MLGNSRLEVCAEFWESRRTFPNQHYGLISPGRIDDMFLKLDIRAVPLCRLSVILASLIDWEADRPCLKG